MLLNKGEIMILNEGFKDRIMKEGVKKSANEHLSDADGIFLVKYRPAGFLPSYTDHESFGINGLPDMNYVETPLNNKGEPAYKFAIREDLVLLYSNSFAMISTLSLVKTFPPFIAFILLPLSKIWISGVSKLNSSACIFVWLKKIDKIIKKNKILLFFIYPH